MPERHASDQHPVDWTLSALLDDELSEDEASVVTRHVATCRGCSDEVERLQSARSLLRNLPLVAAPADLLVRDELGRRDAARAAHRRRAAARLGLGVGLLGMLGTTAYVAGAGAGGGAPRGPVRPPVEVFVVDHVARTGGGPALAPIVLEP